jgi:phytanoyl-CoA hydroxylase
LIVGATALETERFRFSVDEEEAYRAFYGDQGYLAIDDLFTTEEVDAYRRQISAIVRRESPNAEKIYVQVEPSVVHGEATADSEELAVRKIANFVGPDPVLTAMARHPRLVGVVNALIGPDVKLLQDMALLKPPFFGSRKTWHQDCPYFPITPPSVVGCWVALDEATALNGCMHVLPESQKLGAIPHKHLKVEGESFEDFGISGIEGLGHSLPVPLPAGGALFFHGLMVHGTPPNRSPDRRRAVQLHYMDAHCRFTGDPAKQPDYLLISGKTG